MNLPNKLTLSRIIALPFFLFFLLYGGLDQHNGRVFASHIIALLIYIAAMITDIIDGSIARKRNLITNFGKLFDPLADKLLNCSALVAMIELNLIPGWIVILILAREFMVTGLRTLAMSQNRVIAADKWGKGKTTSQVVVIIYGICWVIIGDFISLGLAPGSDNIQALVMKILLWGFYIAVCVCVLFTIGSGWNYIRNNWDLISDKDDDK